MDKIINLVYSHGKIKKLTCVIDRLSQLADTHWLQSHLFLPAVWISGSCRLIRCACWSVFHDPTWCMMIFRCPDTRRFEQQAVHYQRNFQKPNLCGQILIKTKFWYKIWIFPYFSKQLNVLDPILIKTPTNILLKMCKTNK